MERRRRRHTDTFVSVHNSVSLYLSLLEEGAGWWNARSD